MKHILIDFENVKPTPEQLAALDEACHIWLFIGVQQVKQQRLFSADLCEALCRFGKNVHFLRLARQGSNALDFYLSYYLGRITERDNEALICILSRDGGYDVLVEHVRQNGLCNGIGRLGSLEEAALDQRLPEILPNEQESPIGRPVIGNMEFIACCQKTVAALLPKQAFRPKVRRNLQLRLLNLILKDDLQPYSENERRQIAAAVIDRLIAKELLSEEEGFLTYRFDEGMVREQLIRHLLKAQPKTLLKAKNVLGNRITSLLLPFDDVEIQRIIRQCSRENLLRITDGKISYPPFDATVPESACGVSSNMEMLKAAEACLKRYRSVSNRPKSKQALTNALKAHLQRYSVDKAVLNGLVDDLIRRKLISVDKAGTVQY